MSGLITNIGKNLVCNRLASSTYGPLTQFNVGIGSTAPAVTDTALTTPIPIQNIETVDACNATTGWTASGTNSVSTNTSRYTEGGIALNLIKSDTSSAVISMSKTTTNIADFSSKKLWLFIFISTGGHAKLKASGTALFVRFGTDGSNYYQKNYTKAQLTANAWNYLAFSTATADSTTGTPGTANMDYTTVQYETVNSSDTTAAGDFVWDDMKVASSDDYYKALAVGYPAVDTGAHTLTSRFIVSSTECNGATLAEIGVFNSDGTPILYSHDTFTAIEKNNLIEIIFEQVDTIT